MSSKVIGIVNVSNFTAKKDEEGNLVITSFEREENPAFRDFSVEPTYSHHFKTTFFCHVYRTTELVFVPSTGCYVGSAISEKGTTITRLNISVGSKFKDRSKTKKFEENEQSDEDLLSLFQSFIKPKK